MSLFLGIIDADIVLVTLLDNRIYRKGAVELPELMMSLLVMSRAHEESQTKSRRNSASWENMSIGVQI
jgi:hypothetical protein